MSFAPTMQTRARVSVLRELLERERLRVCVVGAGKSGRAATALLEDLGAEPDVLDDAAGAGGISRPFHKSHVDAADLVVLSPGVPRCRPELQGALAAGKLIGEVELASWFIDAPMVAVTGTNGKSTTTALIAHGLEVAGLRVFSGGNLGTPLSDLALATRHGAQVDMAVVELSSYQLESIVEAQFRVGVWLNLTPDHVERYASFAEYGLAKRRILERRAIGGLGIVNAKDSTCARLAMELGGPLRWFSGRGDSDLAGPMGTVAHLDGTARRCGATGEEHYVIDGPGLPGQHNIENAAASIEALRFSGVPPEVVQRALSSFAGLPHRLERVPTDDGRRWINDSKATNVESAVVALKAVEPPVFLLCGGRGKGVPYRPLVEAALQSGVVAVYAYGEDRESVRAAFIEHIPVTTAADLSDVVELARRFAPPGSTVLLSPACASFDQFMGFEHRGDVFKTLVLSSCAREGEA
ncbi:MAG: UDP-N-acetylmuramoyl-L-alanine--D-glutamate ligase [Myxococcota bacterium]